MKKFVSVLLVFVLLLCIATAGAGWYAYTKIQSGDLSFLSMFSKAPSTDLGITYTDADADLVFQTAQTEAKAVSVGDPECATTTCISGKPVWVGTQPVAVEMTNAQVTSIANRWSELSVNAPFTSVQIRVNPDGSADFAGTLSMERVRRFAGVSKIPAETLALIDKYLGSLGDSFPVRVSGNVTITNNQVDANLTNVALGIIPVPAPLLAEYKSEIDSFISDRLLVVPGLSIAELSFAEGKTTLKGTVPQAVYFVR